MEKKKVSKEKVQPWLDALRSGKYQQCKATLKSGELYCCIGVWGVIHNLPIAEDGSSGAPGTPNCPYENISNVFLEPSNLFWEMNDNQDKTFEEIANFVEENYELV